MKSTVRETALFEDMPVFQSVIRLALPSIMGQIILVIYNMADTFFVGMTRSDAMITAVTVCMPAFMFLSAISNLFGVGGASVISRMMGARERDKARHASQFAVWGCLAVSAAYAAGVWLFLDGFIDLLGGAAAPVHSHARSYMMYAVVIGGVVTALNTLLSHLIRAEGRSLQASLGVMLGGVLNIGLDPLFMFVILPRGQEALGAALATMLSNCAALLYFAVLLGKSRGGTVLSLRPEGAMFRSGIPRKVISVGLPACLMTLCENISYAVLDSLLACAGTAAQAGIGVAKKVNMLSHCIVRGMAQGVLPLIGYNYAAKNLKRMRSVVHISAGMSLALSVLCMGLCLSFTGSLIGIFLPGHSASRQYSETFLRIMCLGAPFSAWAYTVISFFQATGKMLRSLLLALLRKGLLDIPLMFLFHRLLPVYGVVAATPTADVICCVAAAALFTLFIRRHSPEPRLGKSPLAEERLAPPRAVSLRRRA